MVGPVAGILALYLFWLGLVILFWLICYLSMGTRAVINFGWNLEVSVTLLADLVASLISILFILFLVTGILMVLFYTSQAQIFYTVVILFDITLGVWRLMVTYPCST